MDGWREGGRKEGRMEGMGEVKSIRSRDSQVNILIIYIM